MSDESGGSRENPRGNPLRNRALAPGRLEALTDGVFAIAMTILVLELHAPDVEGRRAFLEALRDQWPTFGAYVVSFLLLGVYWMGQRSQYDFIRRVDRGLTWLNIFFLLGISTIPFATTLLSKGADVPEAVHFYGLVLLFCSSIHAVIWWYATHPRRDLVDRQQTTPEVVSVGKRLAAVPVVFYLIAMGLSYADFRASLVMFAAVPVLYISDFVRHLRLPGGPKVAKDQDVPE